MLLPFNLHHIAREPKWNMRILIRLGRSTKRRQEREGDHNMQNVRHEFHIRECTTRRLLLGPFMPYEQSTQISG